MCVCMHVCIIYTYVGARRRRTISKTLKTISDWAVMGLVGEFHKVDINGKPFLVYHNILKPLPQIHSPNSSIKETIDSGDHQPPQPFFLCPISRIKSTFTLLDKTWETESEIFLKFETSPLFDDRYGHHVRSSESALILVLFSFCLLFSFLR